MRRLALTIALGLTLIGGAASAQVAARALDSFSELCLPGNSHPDTAAAFRDAGWSTAPDEFDELLAQDVVKPEQAERFVLNYQGGTILASSVSERRGLIRKRNKTMCMVRVFVETPDEMRADFQSRMPSSPDKTTESAKVRADTWTKFLSGRVVAFRAVNVQEGVWSVSVYRVLADG